MTFLFIQINMFMYVHKRTNTPYQFARTIQRYNRYSSFMFSPYIWHPFSYFPYISYEHKKWFFAEEGIHAADRNWTGSSNNLWRALHAIITADRRSTSLPIEKEICLKDIYHDFIRVSIFWCFAQTRCSYMNVYACYITSVGFTSQTVCISS